MARTPIGDLTDDDGKITRLGLASNAGMVPHALRQALMELGVEIDERDFVDDEAFSMDNLRAAYARFAGPSREREA